MLTKPRQPRRYPTVDLPKGRGKPGTANPADPADNASISLTGAEHKAQHHSFVTQYSGKFPAADMMAYSNVYCPSAAFICSDNFTKT
jgi:hypothetical protein